MSFNESLEELVYANENGLLAIHPTWTRVKLADVCSILNGFAFSSKQFKPSGGKPLIRIRDVSRGWTETHFVGDYEPEYVVQQGDLIVGMDGDFKCALWSGEDALLNQRVCKLTVDERYYDKRLLAFALQGYLDAINAKTSSITVKHLSSTTVAEIPLPLLPRQEQTRFVLAIESYFTRLDDAVATLERVQRNLKRYRASVLKSAVEGRLVPTEAELARAASRDYEPASVLLERILAERRRRCEENELAKMKARGKTRKDDNWRTKYLEPLQPRHLSPLPDGWVWTTVDQLTVLIDGGSAVTATSQVTTRRVLRSSAVRQGSVDFTDYRFLPNDASASEDAFLCEGDLLFTRLSGTLEYVGNCAVVPSLAGERFEFPDRIFRARANALMFGPYIALCFGALHLRVRLEAAAKSSAGHQRISLSDLRQFHIPLPPFTEQLRIVAEAERLLSVAATTNDDATLTIRRLHRLRQSILKWAFEGRLVDQDPADEPASVLLERIQSERAASAETSKSNKKPRKGKSANA